jgi:hypothetical protein
MNSNEFKRYYLKWSNAVIFCIMGLLMSVVAADAFLGFDFSKDMYTICFIATGCMLGFMSMTWISALNFIFSGRREVAIPSLSDEERANLDVICDCVRAEGYMPMLHEDDEKAVSFKINGNAFSITYTDECFALYKEFEVSSETDMVLLKEASAAIENTFFLVKIFIRKSEDGSYNLIFQVPMAVSTARELRIQFAKCIRIMHNSIRYHQEKYRDLMLERQGQSLEAGSVETSEHKVLS